MSTRPGSASRLAMIGEACGLALVGSLVCALPTAYRAGGTDAGRLDVLVAALAVVLCFMAPVALLLPRAARGWRGIVGKDPPASLALGVAIWVGLSAVLLVGLAALLKAKTHHRGLGGATFGMIGAVVICVAAVVTVRLVGIGRRGVARGWPRWLISVGAAVVLLLPLLVLGTPMVLGGAGDAAPQARAVLFDLALAVVVASLLLVREVPAVLAPATRLVALPLALCLLVVGFLRVETSHTAESIKQSGGVVGAVLTVLEMWTDSDDDGVGAHFGGRDCDEGDPRRHPRAIEIAGDGIDSDCEGLDAPATAVVTAAAAPSLGASGATRPAAVTSEARAGKPDIIFVTLDTVRADRTSV